MLCGFLGQSSPNLNFGSERQIINNFFLHIVFFSDLLRSHTYEWNWRERAVHCVMNLICAYDIVYVVDKKGSTFQSNSFSLSIS